MKISVILSAALLALTLVPRPSAQAITRCPLPKYSSSCSPFVWPGFEGAASSLPVGTVCCNPSGAPNGEDCIAARAGCSVPNTAFETCLSCNRGKTSQTGSPIDLASGNTYIVQQDVSLPGLGGGLRLTRTWNSLFPALQNSFPSMFGTNWRSTYEERLIFNSSDLLLKYARSDGSIWSFGVISISPNTYTTVAPANDNTTITQGTQSYTLLFKSGEKRTFDLNTGVLLSIIDRNGNTTQLTYDTQGRLSSVTDPAARHLSFTYVSTSSRLVSSVSSDTGITYSYAYDGQGRLTQVTKPDNTTENFAYDLNSRITTVTDSQGKVLESHTYDIQGRGLTSSRASGVDSVTVTYPQ